ncbi:hypothetical protein GCM10010390_19150 [Streptomyces mordarskii]|uniref:Uncharacterized protein n=1 Tax=Streptomyces mordarskii TaxID=1226758 RepID=A0ABP3MDT4_9ACTN
MRPAARDGAPESASAPDIRVPRVSYARAPSAPSARDVPGAAATVHSAATAARPALTLRRSFIARHSSSYRPVGPFNFACASYSFARVKHEGPRHPVPRRPCPFPARRQ